jgi:kynurenine 3-monooxygenase
VSARGEVSVLGAGLVGPVTAMLLARRGYRVTLFDRRADPATAPPERGRSVHLVLSERGWRTLRMLGLEARVRRIGMPLTGRHIHLWRGDRLEQPYARDGQTIFSVDRARLHAELVAAAAEVPGVTLRWGLRCRWVDLEGQRLGFTPERGRGAEAPDGPRGVRDAPDERDAVWVPYERLLAADGAFSVLRAALQEGRFDHQQFWLELGYKEIRFPSVAEGGVALSARHFQVWPRSRLFLTAFPNQDGSFTGSLFLPWHGSPSFESVTTEAEFGALLRSFFPDLLPLERVLWPQYRDNPASGLVTVRCSPWSRGGRVLLLGDAAHAVVPFFGQGMNCGFEDARVLDEALDAHDDDWERALPAFEASRRPNVHALSEMSVRHYEHLNHVPDPLDPLRERVGAALDRLAPWRFRPLYELVAFTSVPYATAYRLDQLRARTIEDVVRDPAFAGGWPDDAEARLVARLRSP